MIGLTPGNLIAHLRRLEAVGALRGLLNGL